MIMVCDKIHKIFGERVDVCGTQVKLFVPKIRNIPIKSHNFSGLFNYFGLGKLMNGVLSKQRIVDPSGWKTIKHQPDLEVILKGEFN